MPRYEVTVWLGTLTTEVDAPNEDEATVAATDHWDESADHWQNASFEVREVES